MSLNSYLVTDEIRPLPGSGWTSKNAANAQDSITKYKEKLNIPRGQKGYIDPAAFKIKEDFNKDDLVNLQPKRSCVVSKPECVQYNYVIPKEYLQEGTTNAKIENEILGNELVELQAQHDDLNTSHDELQRQQDLIKQELEVTREIMKDTEDSKNNKIDMLNKHIEELESRLESQDVNNFFNSHMSVAPTTNVRKGGGTRHKRNPCKTKKRRITRRLRSAKIPRKCFSLRKREK